MGNERVKISCPALKQMAKREGTNRTAELLGCSNSTIAQYVRDDSAVVSVEIAARHFNSKNDKEQGGQCIAMVKVPSGKRQAFMNVIEAFGFDHKLFDL